MMQLCDPPVSLDQLQAYNATIYSPEFYCLLMSRNSTLIVWSSGIHTLEHCCQGA